MVTQPGVDRSQSSGGATDMGVLSLHHCGIHVQQEAVTIPFRKLSHHLPDPFWFFPIPKRGFLHLG